VGTEGFAESVVQSRPAAIEKMVRARDHVKIGVGPGLKKLKIHKFVLITHDNVYRLRGIVAGWWRC
jgi:hypothetical protein